MRADLSSVLFALVMATTGLPVFADGLAVYGGAAVSFAPGGDSATTEDLNLYVEGDLNNFYLGASGDAYNDTASNEIDLSLGYRNTTAGGLSYDFSYTRNYFPGDRADYPRALGDCCGDIDMILSLPVGDKLTTTLDLNYYPEDKTSDAHLKLDYMPTDKITLTAKFGGARNAGAANTADWKLTARYQLGEETAIKLNYYDGSDTKGYLGVDLTWDTTLFGG